MTFTHMLLPKALRLGLSVSGLIFPKLSGYPDISVYPSGNPMRRSHSVGVSFLTTHSVPSDIVTLSGWPSSRMKRAWSLTVASVPATSSYRRGPLPPPDTPCLVRIVPAHLIWPHTPSEPLPEALARASRSSLLDPRFPDMLSGSNSTSGAASPSPRHPTTNTRLRPCGTGPTHPAIAPSLSHTGTRTSCASSTLHARPYPQSPRHESNCPKASPCSIVSELTTFSQTTHLGRSS